MCCLEVHHSLKNVIFRLKIVLKKAYLYDLASDSSVDKMIS